MPQAVVLIDAAFSIALGLAVASLALIMTWSLVWMVIGLIGALRRTCGWMFVLSGLSATVIAGSCLSAIFWGISSSRLGSGAFAVGLAGMAVLLATAASRKLADGRRLGPAFWEGSCLLLSQLWGLHREEAEAGCGHCHEQQ
jgi:hypothetical protein